MAIPRAIDDQRGPSECKVAGMSAYWMRKLKPFSFEPEYVNKNKGTYKTVVTSNYLNEIIAVQYACSYVHDFGHRVGNGKFLRLFKNNFIVQFRSGVYSPYSVAMLLETLYSAYPPKSQLYEKRNVQIV